MSNPQHEQAQAGRWLLDARRSSAEFRVPHFWGLIDVKGQFDRLDGSYDGHTIDLSVDAGSLDTGHKKRDEHLRQADFFDVESHPQVRFRSTSITETSADTLHVVGELEAAGRTVGVNLDAVVHADGEELEIEAETTVDHRLFGMTWNRLRAIRSPATLHVRARLIQEKE